MKFILSFFALLLLVTSCSEKCPDTIDIGKHSLSDQSKSLFPYQKGEQKLVFKDSLNNELVFEIVRGENNDFTASHWEEDCQQDSLKTKSIEITAEIQSKSLRLKPSVDHLGFDILIKQKVEVDASDPAHITEIDGLRIYRSNVGNFGHITDSKNSSPEELPSETVDEIVINGKKFKNLLKSRSVNSGDLYYSPEKGLVALNENYGDSGKPKFWVLEKALYK